MPAFGLTGPRKDNDYSVSTYVDFLDRFLKQIGVDSFALSGNSLGGEIAWRYALAHPAKVSKLILVDPAGFYAEKGNGAIIFKLAKIKWFAALMSKMDTKIIVNQTLKDVYEDDTKITDAQIQLYYDMSMREGNRESFSHQSTAGRQRTKTGYFRHQYTNLDTMGQTRQTYRYFHAGEF
jgi:pimeloyl-ACP methyl ester carboxylesterase